MYLVIHSSEDARRVSKKMHLGKEMQYWVVNSDGQKKKKKISKLHEVCIGPLLAPNLLLEVMFETQANF
jgi:hypothetical protein